MTRATMFASDKGDLPFNMALVNNLAATTNPAVTDDSSKGYEIGSMWLNKSTQVIWTCSDATAGAAVWFQGGVNPAELALLNGASPGAVVASKVVVYGADSLIAFLAGAIAATGTNQATAAPLTNQLNPVTGADGTVGVALPAAAANKIVVVTNTDATHGLPVYPVNGGNDQINAVAVNSPVILGPGRTGIFSATSGTQWYVDTAALATVTPAQINLLAQGVAAGYKIARGVHQQAAASDTIVTGLATVVAVVASWRDEPTLKQMFVTASIGNQTGAPAAGSILINTYKPTANNDVTPTAATDFTDNLSINWIAIGT